MPGKPCFIRFYAVSNRPGRAYSPLIKPEAIARDTTQGGAYQPFIRQYAFSNLKPLPPFLSILSIRTMQIIDKACCRE